MLYLLTSFRILSGPVLPISVGLVGVCSILETFQKVTSVDMVATTNTQKGEYLQSSQESGFQKLLNVQKIKEKRFFGMLAYFHGGNE